jgi:hypothetical protein
LYVNEFVSETYPVDATTSNVWGLDVFAVGVPVKSPVVEIVSPAGRFRDDHDMIGRPLRVVAANCTGVIARFWKKFSWDVGFVMVTSSVRTA